MTKKHRSPRNSKSQSKAIQDQIKMSQDLSGSLLEEPPKTEETPKNTPQIALESDTQKVSTEPTFLSDGLDDDSDKDDGTLPKIEGHLTQAKKGLGVSSARYQLETVDNFFKMDTSKGCRHRSRSQSQEDLLRDNIPKADAYGVIQSALSSALVEWRVAKQYVDKLREFKLPDPAINHLCTMFLAMSNDSLNKQLKAVQEELDGAKATFIACSQKLEKQHMAVAEKLAVFPNLVEKLADTTHTLGGVAVELKKVPKPKPEVKELSSAEQLRMHCKSFAGQQANLSKELQNRLAGVLYEQIMTQSRAKDILSSESIGDAIFEFASTLDLAVIGLE